MATARGLRPLLTLSRCRRGRGGAPGARVSARSPRRRDPGAQERRRCRGWALPAAVSVSVPPAGARGGRAGRVAGGQQLRLPGAEAAPPASRRPAAAVRAGAARAGRRGAGAAARELATRRGGAGAGAAQLPVEPPCAGRAGGAAEARAAPGGAAAGGRRHRQREKQAPRRELDAGLDPGTPGSHPGPQTDVPPAEERLRQAVLQTLRRTTYHWQELTYNERLSLVYMAARLDGGFAAVSRAFHEIRTRVPEFQPQTLMDFGSGTGSVTWAAHSAWGQSLREYMCVDSSAAMLDLAEKLLKGGSGSGEPHVPGVFFRQFLPVSPKVQFDVVVSAFSLSELPSKAHRTETVQTLWRKTGHFLVLVENGTKAGHCLLMDARDLVLKGKEKSPLDPRPGFVFAPCPHELPCPQLAASKPLACSFSQAYHCIPFSWNKKKQKEEKFSMVILARGRPEEAPRWPRLTQPVLKRPRHVHCHLCCPDGHMQHAVITARQHGRDLYRCARVSSWGDLLPVITPSESELPPSPAEDPLRVNKDA
ncbi:ribosome assembly protein METTL17, mitochondrial isoform X2 [Vulpes vulpes]|uniref:Ribosome assembly protein METTL17, mitochondrial isoform X2 n=1 Tax=Vulpes vulpes TaxID=9627 RepID=A0ABM4XQU0_VULVU